MAGYRPDWDDLQEAFKDIEPGEYRSRDLLPHFNRWGADNRKPGITAKTLGEALRRETCLEHRSSSGNVVGWLFEQRGLECRNWFAEAKAPDAPGPVG